jgi:Bacterial toxin 4
MENDKKQGHESLAPARETKERPGRPADEMLPSRKSEGRMDSYMGKTAKDFPPLPADGSKVQFHPEGSAWQTREGTVTVETKLGPASPRQGFESFLPAGAALGAAFFERSHAQGAGTGVESPYAIALAPQVVNQEFQNRGIEEELREMQRQKRDDVNLFLRTEVSTTRDGLFLKGINYQLYAQKQGERAKMIYAASLEVQGLNSTPKILIDAQPMNWTELDSYLKDPKELVVGATR